MLKEHSTIGNGRMYDFSSADEWHDAILREHTLADGNFEYSAELFKADVLHRSFGVPFDMHMAPGVTVHLPISITEGDEPVLAVPRTHNMQRFN